MRTKDKARRRVSSFRSLDFADNCMHSQPPTSSSVVFLGKRPVSHVDGTAQCSPSAGKKARSSTCSTNTSPNQTRGQNFLGKVLQGSNAPRELGGGRKRKAVDIHELPEFTPAQDQPISPEPMLNLPVSPAKKNCAQTDSYLFSFLCYLPFFDRVL